MEGLVNLFAHGNTFSFGKSSATFLFRNEVCQLMKNSKTNFFESCILQLMKFLKLFFPRKRLASFAKSKKYFSEKIVCQLGKNSQTNFFEMRFVVSGKIEKVFFRKNSSPSFAKSKKYFFHAESRRTFPQRKSISATEKVGQFLRGAKRGTLEPLLVAVSRGVQIAVTQKSEFWAKKGEKGRGFGKIVERFHGWKCGCFVTLFGESR